MMYGVMTPEVAAILIQMTLFCSGNPARWQKSPTFTRQVGSAGWALSLGLTKRSARGVTTISGIGWVARRVGVHPAALDLLSR